MRRILGLCSLFVLAFTVGCGAHQSTGQSPALSNSKASFAFGQVPVAATTTQSTVLTSSGSAAAAISGVTISGQGFSVSGITPPLTLNPGQTASITVSFTPPSVGDYTGILTLISNAGPVVINLSGTGVAAPGVLQSLACNSSSMTGSGSDTCTVTLTAPAGAGDLAAQLVSNNSSVVVPPTVTVPAGASSATFDASVFAVNTAQSATITASAGGISTSVSLQLSPVIPVLAGFACTPATLTPGAASADCTVQLSGPAPAAMTATVSSSSGSVTVPATLAFAAGASSATFTASAASVSTAQSATLTIAMGGPALTFTLSLSAATPALTVDSTVAFGNVQVGSTATQTITLNSTGSAPVTISDVTVTGTDVSSSGTTTPLVVNPGQSTNLNVQFAPSKAESISGQVTIRSNATGGTITIPISGTGVEPSYLVELTWTAPADPSDPIVGYNVYRAVSGGTAYLILNSAVNETTTYSDSTVKSGESYVYYVTSVDADGNQSSPSNTWSTSIP